MRGAAAGPDARPTRRDGAAHRPKSERNEGDGRHVARNGAEGASETAPGHEADQGQGRLEGRKREGDAKTLTPGGAAQADADGDREGVKGKREGHDEHLQQDEHATLPPRHDRSGCAGAQAGMGGQPCTWW